MGTQWTLGKVWIFCGQTLNVPRVVLQGILDVKRNLFVDLSCIVYLYKMAAKMVQAIGTVVGF